MHDSLFYRKPKLSNYPIFRQKLRNFYKYLVYYIKINKISSNDLNVKFLQLHFGCTSFYKVIIFVINNLLQH